MFEELGRNEKDEHIRLVLHMDGPLIQNVDIKAADLRIPHSTLIGAAIDWYGSELGNAYRILTMDELPPLPARPEMTNWPSNGTTAHFMLEPDDYSKLEEHMTEELLAPEEAGIKILTCYLFGVGADQLDIKEIQGRAGRDEFGFTRSQPPRPDPRDE